MNSLRLDFRLAWRRLRNSPGFTLVAAGSLALGIGANLALLSIINAVLWIDLPFPEAARIVILREGIGKDGVGGVSFPNYLDIRKANRTLENLTVFASANLPVLAGEWNGKVAAELVDEGYFELLGARPVLGRLFSKDEPGVVISHGFWKRCLGGDRTVLGRTLRAGDAALPITGVAPSGFRGFADEAELWIPIRSHNAVNTQRPVDFLKQRDIHWLEMIGRLKPGVTVEAARANLDPVMRRLAEQDPAANQDRDHLVITSLRDHRVGASRHVLWVVAAATGFVFLIACLNVGNLLLARGAARDREISLRLWLGASAAAAGRAQLCESVLLALGGALAGVLIAAWSTSAIVAVLPLEVPAYARPVLDSTMAATAVVLTFAAGLILGLPAMLRRPRAALSERGGSAGLDARRLRMGLVMLETALATALLFGAVQMLRSLWNLSHQDLGFRPEKLIAVQFQAPVNRYRTPEARARFGMEIAAKAAALPGVDRAALTTTNPLAFTGINRGFLIEGGEPLRGASIEEVRFIDVSPGFFEAAGIPLARGRDFDSHDRHESPEVAIVSESFAERYFGTTEALGRRLRYLSSKDFKTVVGIARDAKLRNIARAADAEKVVYVPVLQNRESLRDLTVLARVAGSPDALVETLRRVVQRADPENAILGAEALGNRLARQSRSTVNLTMLFGIFAALAAGLAALGVAGVLGHFVASRRREIGIRMAVGATTPRILRLIGLEAARMVVLGCAAGLLLAWWQGRVLANVVFGLRSDDSAGYVVVSVLAGLVGLAAALLPARAAVRVDPAAALRGEQ